jgi:hypothetical protein
MPLPVIGALIGRHASRGDRKRQEELYDEALRQYEGLEGPDFKEIEARTLDRSMYNLPDSFGGREAQDRALAALEERAYSGDMDPQSRLAMEEARLAGANQAARGMATVQQNAARRGMGGNAAILGQAMAQQAGAQTASLGGMRAAADRQERSLRAMESAGGLAGQIEGQRSALAMDRARQLDAINRWEGEMGFQTDNANNRWMQQGFDNRLGIADRRHGAQTQRGNQYGKKAQGTVEMWRGIGEGLQDTALAAGQMMMGAPPTAAMGGGAPRQQQGGYNPYDPNRWGW